MLHEKLPGILHNLLGKAGVRQNEDLSYPLTDVERAKEEFQRTGTLLSQKVHVNEKENRYNVPFDLYFENPGEEAYPAFIDEFQSGMREKESGMSNGSKRVIVLYLSHLNRIVWSPNVQSDTNIESAISIITKDEKLSSERHHLEIFSDQIYIDAQNKTGVDRFIAFLEKAVPNLSSRRVKLQFYMGKKYHTYIGNIENVKKYIRLTE